MLHLLRLENAPRVKKALRIGSIIALAAIPAILLRNLLADALVLVFGAAAVAFLTQPLASVYEKKLSRPVAAFFAMGTLAFLILGALALLLPVLVREIAALARELPASIDQIKRVLLRTADWAKTYFPDFRLPMPSMSSPELPKLASGTMNLAGGVADFFYQGSLILVLGYFLLCDRERLLLRLELLVPQSARRLAVRMGNAICRELKLYLRGQGLIALAVGTLAAAGLAFIGVRSALALGVVVGVLNMIPYFGPVLGGIPAVLMALSDGWQTALMTVAVLWLVQQLDSALISPRILGGLTGLSPAAVLLAIFLGSSAAGVPGMLLALPVLMAFRTVFRVFVQRHENV